MEQEVYDFGLRLKKLREERNLTQQAVASKLGVTVQTIIRYEGNTQLPPIDKLETIALLYRTSLDYLRNLEHRKPVYIDDLSDNMQKMVLFVIESVREEGSE